MKDLLMYKAVYDPDLFTRLRLTDYLRRTVKYVVGNPGGVTSTEVAQHFSISTHLACIRLKSVYIKGYVQREQRVHSSGGVEYVYTVDMTRWI